MQSNIVFRPRTFNKHAISIIELLSTFIDASNHQFFRCCIYTETDFWRRKIRPFLDFVKPNKCRYYWTFLKAIHIKFLASFRNQFKILFGNRKSHNPILWVIETQIFTTSSQIVTFDLCCDYGVDSIATYFSFALRFSIRFSFNAENDTWHVELFVVFYSIEQSLPVNKFKFSI